MGTTHDPQIKKRDNATYNGTLRGYLTFIRAAVPARVAQITVDELLSIYVHQEERCAISGIKMTHKPGYDQPLNISIDRIVAGGSYAAANVQLICKFVNLVRGTLPVTEAQEVMKHIALETARHYNLSLPLAAQAQRVNSLFLPAPLRS